MEINFDLLVSGCNTRCAHCYVNGGPGKNMPAEDALLCIERLDRLAALLPEHDVCFTLDNEPFNHPEVSAIVRAAAAVRNIKYFHHGMTTGIALIGRRDREEALRAYLDCGYKEFGITLHGGAAHHDALVQRDGAFERTVAAAEFLKEQGAELDASLMFNRFFPEDAAELDAVLGRLAPEFVYFAVPNYTPNDRMPAFERYRGRLS
ncbi:MAG: radical SAM protein, partial [Clostridia bacterium]|nr:radical SAM protein [Clostridia bacterium]